MNKKYILLDFWATWCLPCREDFSFLKILHEKYNSKGFEIISISKDEKIDLWKKIILKDSIQDWIHYSVKLNNTDVEKKYAVTAIPVKILIDLDGKIIGRWKGGGDENKSEIEKALKAVILGEKYFSSQTQQTFFENQTSNINLDLTQREKEVLQFIVQEKTTKEIAVALFISEKTVETHRGNLMLKLEARNIAGVVRKAIMLGLVEI